jgi:DNA-binding MarR family transcriptional regulator/GNAT superfamily N-acetyltransferase
MNSPENILRQFRDSCAQHLGAGLSAPERLLLALSAHPSGITAGELAANLGQDAGYLSRLVSQLRARRWVRRQRDALDGRRQLLQVTALGEKRLAKIHQREQESAEKLLAPLSDWRRAEVLRLMARLPLLLRGEGSEPVIFRALQPGDAGWIIHRHATLIAPEFGWNASFEALCARIMADFMDNFQPECERSWIVERGGEILGSLFLIREDAATAKLRLLYVEPAARGMGLARKLLEKSIQFARDKGYRRVSLFTTSNLLTARRLYVRLGFQMVDDTIPAPFGEGIQGERWLLDLG